MKVPSVTHLGHLFMKSFATRDGRRSRKRTTSKQEESNRVQGVQAIVLLDSEAPRARVLFDSNIDCQTRGEHATGH